MVNNAAGVFGRREVTADGIEKTLATNHLAPFLLTNLLLDLIRRAPAGRIVSVASESHAAAIDWNNLQSHRGYNFFKAYLLSKTCNILFTYELARRLADTRVTANAVSPGPTLTNFARDQGGALLPSSRAGLRAREHRALAFDGIGEELGYGAHSRRATQVWMHDER